MPSWFEIGDLVPPSSSSFGSKVTTARICALIHTVQVTSMMAAPHKPHRYFTVTLPLLRRIFCLPSPTHQKTFWVRCKEHTANCNQTIRCSCTESHCWPVCHHVNHILNIFVFLSLLLSVAPLFVSLVKPLLFLLYTNIGKDYRRI